MAFMVVAIADIQYTIGEDQFVIALNCEQPVEVKCTWSVVRTIHFLEKIQNSFLVVSPRFLHIVLFNVAHLQRSLLAAAESPLRIAFMPCI